MIPKEKIREAEIKFKEQAMLQAIEHGKDLAFWGLSLANLPEYENGLLQIKFSAKEIPYEYADRYECDCCGCVAIPELANAELINLHNLQFIANMSQLPINPLLKDAEKAWLKNL